MRHDLKVEAVSLKEEQLLFDLRRGKGKLWRKLTAQRKKEESAIHIAKFGVLEHEGKTDDKPIATGSSASSSSSPVKPALCPCPMGAIALLRPPSLLNGGQMAAAAAVSSAVISPIRRHKFQYLVCH